MSKSSKNLENKYAIIQVGDSVVKKIQLKDDLQEVYTFSFRDQTGAVEVKNGAIRMLPMSQDICPESICSNTGWIQNEYQVIVCLPNKIIVTIEGATEVTTDGIDSITFY